MIRLPYSKEKHRFFFAAEAVGGCVNAIFESISVKSCQKAYTFQKKKYTSFFLKVGNMRKRETKPYERCDSTGIYKQYLARKRAVIPLLLGAAFFLAVMALGTGASGMSPRAVLSALCGIGDATNVMIVRNIRLPRIFAAVLAGAGLSLAGCVMQNVLRNPLASPSTLGVSNAAVFGANFAILLLGAGRFHATDGAMLTLSNPYLVTLCAFLSALGSAFLILALSGRRGFSPSVVVLSGVALGALFSAGTTILQYLSLDTEVTAAVFWTFGDLGRASYGEDAVLFVTVLAAFVYFMFRRNDYNILANGDDTAHSLGVRVGRIRFFSLFLASLLCAVSVSFLGIIGFLGLAAPQIARRVVGNDHRFLLPASALCGSCLLLFSDILARSVLSGVSLPVGAVTALYGGPILLWILLKKKGGGVL